MVPEGAEIVGFRRCDNVSYNNLGSNARAGGSRFSFGNPLAN